MCSTGLLGASLDRARPRKVSTRIRRAQKLIGDWMSWQCEPETRPPISTQHRASALRPPTNPKAHELPLSTMIALLPRRRDTTCALTPLHALITQQPNHTYLLLQNHTDDDAAATQKPFRFTKSVVRSHLVGYFSVDSGIEDNACIRS